jgi:hypothetical protein
MTTPTPQCWRPVPSACEIEDVFSRVCSLGTRGCRLTHTSPAYRNTDYKDATNINRLNFAVQELADALAAAGGDLIDRKGWVRESDIARAALDAARGRVVDQQARPSTAEKPTWKTGNQFLLERIAELEAVLKNYGIVESEWRESKPPAPQ